MINLSPTEITQLCLNSLENSPLFCDGDFVNVHPIAE